MKLWPVVTGVAIALTLVACKSPTPPKGVQPISGFDASRYLGKWYEVARLENRFERGLEQVTATYGARSDGGISVVNRGYDPVKKRWNESDGESLFHRRPHHRGAEGVVLPEPFYGGYNVIRLDDDYQYALVSGPNRDYLWILSRTPHHSGGGEAGLPEYRARAGL
ncbi:lipocalin family protein [Klebsiella pneumoniae subsp. pneumoniae]|nr:lipocalin family protein [Klebsiella pneumoniae subsp. pneumoniae]